MPDTTIADQVHDQAQTAADAVRGLAHATVWRHPIPAPELYRILGELESLTFSLKQALHQLGHNLHASLDAYHVYDDLGADPNTSIAATCQYLDQAGHHLAVAGHAIDDGRAQIAAQGYRTPAGVAR